MPVGHETAETSSRNECTKCHATPPSVERATPPNPLGASPALSHTLADGQLTLALAARELNGDTVPCFTSPSKQKEGPVSWESDSQVAGSTVMEPLTGAEGGWN
jgi:hypothetical protein